MDAHHAGITTDLTVTAFQCRTLAKVSSITLKEETLQFKKRIKTTVVKQKDFIDNGADLSDKYSNEKGLLWMGITQNIRRSCRRRHA